MTKRMQWFHCYPEKWLAALAGMNPLTAYVYLIVCFRIYERRGPIADSAASLRKRCNAHRTSDVQRALDELLEAGKLYLTKDGELMNPFALEQLESARTKHASVGRTLEKSEEKQRELSLDIEIERDIDTDSRESVSIGASRKKRHSARQQMPEDWEPDAKGIVFARDLGFSEQKITQLVMACRDYHLKHGTLIAGAVGLAATWRTWCNNEVKYSAERKQRYGYGGPRPLQDDSLSASRAAARLREKAERGEFVIGPRPGSILPAASGSHVEHVPQRRNT